MPTPAVALRVLAAVAVLSVLLGGVVAPIPAQAAARGRYIVVLKADVGDPFAVAGQFRRDRGVAVGRVYRSALKGFSAEIPVAVVALLRRDPRVASIEVDLPVQAFDQSLPTGVDRINAERNPVAPIAGDGGAVDADVAILDTGVGPHDDLNLVGGTDCTRTTGQSYADDNGHGTHVAGIAGALDNGIGVAGVAPGVRLWSVKVLDRFGSGSWSNIICGIDWVTANAATIDVAVMSLGGAGTEGAACTSSSLRRAICNSVNAGVTYSVAAGNAARDASGTVPATFPEVITVSALADFDGRAGGGAPSTCRIATDDAFWATSNFGNDVDLAAPGVCITSTLPNNAYGIKSGTSMAAPHVAGAAALHIAANGRVGPTAVKAALRASREPAALAGDPDGIAEGVVHPGGPNRPPTARLADPAAGRVVGSVPIRIEATDDEGPLGVLTAAYRIDDEGPFVAAAYNADSERYEATWDASTVSGLDHTITARVTDRDGAVTLADPVAVRLNAPPVADAGPDQEAVDVDGDGVQSVTLDGSGSTDEDGTIPTANYVWTENGTPVATGADAAADLEVGEHTITLTVTDEDGATDDDELLVAVAGNGAPTADAGADQILADADGDGSAIVALDGTGSSDLDGALVGFDWTIGATVLASDDDPAASVSLPVGRHVVTLTVTDDGGTSATDEVVIEVVANATPSALAGPDQTVRDTGGDGVETVVVVGGGSDPDGEIAGVTWSEAGVVLATEATAALSLAVGEHELVFTVTDNGGATATDVVLVTVGSNDPPVAAAGNDLAGSDADGDGSVPVGLNGSASVDPDGTVVGYAWSEGGALVATGATPTLTVGVGVHVFTLTVTDNDGAVGSDEVVVTIAANQAPTANAGVDQVVTDANADNVEVVTVAATGADADGAVVVYRWYRNGVLLAEAPAISVNLAVGTHVLTVVATDNGGATATDDIVVTVQPGPPLAVTSLRAYRSTSGTIVALTWVDNAINETGYRVYRSLDRGVTWTMVKDNLPANTKRWDNTGLTRGATYTYYVVAFNAAGESPRSAIVTIVA